jgi:hypothetical protein
MEPSYVIGLDLGQASDFSALAVLERTLRPAPEAPEHRQVYFACRLLRRFPLGTPYPAVVEQVRELTTRAPLPGSTLAVDQTGVGRAVVDLLRQAHLPVQLWPITITAGCGVTATADGLQVPKRALVSALLALLHTQRLQVAPVPERALLVQELQAFTVQITSAGHEVFTSRRPEDHDDLVLAVALAAWAGEHFQALPDPGPFGSGPRRRRRGSRV